MGLGVHNRLRLCKLIVLSKRLGRIIVTSCNNCQDSSPTTIANEHCLPPSIKLCFNRPIFTAPFPTC